MRADEDRTDAVVTSRGEPYDDRLWVLALAVYASRPEIPEYRLGGFDWVVAKVENRTLEVELETLIGFVWRF